MHGVAVGERAGSRNALTVSRLVCAHVGHIQPRVVIFRGERESGESFDRPNRFMVKVL